MTHSEKVTAYIEKHSQWRKQLEQLRKIFNETELVEEIKWGAPSYSLNKKLVAGMAAFKNYCGIWFHQGVFLKDVENKLHNAQEGKTKALRQWRFGAHETIPEDLVHEYVQEAIENCLAGKEIKPKRGPVKVMIPPLLASEFSNNPTLKVAFENLSPSNQRDYADHIRNAKREATKQSRLEKAIPLILAGKGLYDKYKNC